MLNDVGCSRIRLIQSVKKQCKVVYSCLMLRTLNPFVVGSTPTWPTINIKGLQVINWQAFFHGRRMADLWRESVGILEPSQGQCSLAFRVIWFEFREI